MRKLSFRMCSLTIECVLLLQIEGLEIIEDESVNEKSVDTRKAPVGFGVCSKESTSSKVVCSKESTSSRNLSTPARPPWVLVIKHNCRE